MKIEHKDSKIAPLLWCHTIRVYRVKENHALVQIKVQRQKPSICCHFVLRVNADTLLLAAGGRVAKAD